MIFKTYTFQYEANQFSYGLGKGHQQYMVRHSTLDLKFEKSQGSILKISQIASVYGIPYRVMLQVRLTDKAKAWCFHTTFNTNSHLMYIC